MTATHELIVETGRTFRSVIDWLNNDGTPIDMRDQGWSAKLDVRLRPTSSSTIIQFRSDNSQPGTITLGNGTVTLYLADEFTAALPLTLPHPAGWSLNVYSPSGEVDGVLDGAFLIDPAALR